MTTFFTQTHKLSPILLCSTFISFNKKYRHGILKAFICHQSFKNRKHVSRPLNKKETLYIGKANADDTKRSTILVAIVMYNIMPLSKLNQTIKEMFDF